MSSPCRLCQSPAVEMLLDFGPQPIASRYLAVATAEEARFPMEAGVCRACGLFQLTHLVPPAELLPRFEWITYAEPEDHLDDLAGALVALCPLPDGPVLGISTKDDTLLARMALRGMGGLKRLDLAEDLGILEPQAGMETIQDRLTPARARQLALKHGKARMVIARHILEHAHQIREFLAALGELLTPGGALVLEIPDCGRALAQGDLTTLWEEHTCYFTETTFGTCLGALGFSLDHLDRIPYPFEDSLVAIARKRGARLPPPALAEQLALAHTFVERSAARTKGIRAYLDQARQGGERIALFGAGHLATAFVNLLELGDVLDFAVDDHPAKRGMFLPGSRLPIRGSQSLQGEGVTLCLLSLNPLGETRIVARQGTFLERGGRFASIFPASGLAIPLG